LRRTLLAGVVIAVGGLVLTASADRARPLPAPTAEAQQDVPPTLTAIINASAPTDDLFSGHFCAGSLIAPTKVLAAAHCFERRGAAPVDVVVGATNLCAGSPIMGERRRVTHIQIHPEAESDRRVDIAVLTLAGSVPVTPVPLAPVREDSPLVAWGWGRVSEQGRAPCFPRPVQLRSADRVDCDTVAQRYGRVFDQTTQICLTPDENELHNTCIGDSGGPVIASDGQAHVAVVSWGPSCGQDAVGFYSATGYVAGWIAGAA
jgi:secreted trypsin-like serine protease